MTTISQLTQADVAALKCLIFVSVKNMMESEWYGIDCNEDELFNLLDTSFGYLQILNSSCTINHALECEIKNWVKRQTVHCLFSSIACTTRTTTTELDILLTEDSQAILTEDSQTILI